LQQKIPITETETAGTLHDKMMETGADLLLQTIQQIDNGFIKEVPQPSTINLQSSILQTAPKLFTETCQINWDQPTNQIDNFIRGLSPYPTAFTFLEGKKLKVFSSEKEKTGLQNEPGKIFTDHKTFLKFATKDGFICLKKIQMEGKKRMGIEDFLRGWRK
jgi:methionyl-tRNA formyltransferase